MHVRQAQSVRAWVGKARSALETVDKVHGGAPLLIDALFVDGHTRYQLDPRGAEAIARFSTPSTRRWTT